MGMVNTLKRLALSLLAILWAVPSFGAVKLYTQNTAPATCNLGDLWVDTNATSGERFYTCESANTWVLHVGYGTTSNPSFNSVHASGGNLAAANKQVTKAWQSGLSYTSDVTSVIHGGQHYICTSTHTAGSTTEPGVGADWATVWTIASGSGSVSDTAYGAGWNGDTTTAPSKNAVYDKIETLAGGHDAVTLGTDADAILGLSTQQITLDSQTANYVFAAPNGSAGDPTFRALVAADLPATVMYSGSSGYVFNMGALSDLQYGGNTLIDDTATNGATTRLWSADKVYDELALKAPLTSPGFTTAANPVSADGAALGTTSLEWSDLYLASGGVIYGENDQSNTITSSSTGFNFNLPIGLLSSNDPDVAAEGKIAWDANGDVLRGYDGTRQVAVARVQKEIQVTVIKPNDLDDAQRDAFLVWSNNSGMSFVVTGWYAWSTSDDTDLNIEETDGDGANNATVDAVSITTNGTGIYYASDSTITAGTIENGHILWLDFDDTDAPAQVHVTIYGYYNADVN